MIDNFRGLMAFLSNFAPCRMEVDGISYPTLEHAFQAAKTNDIEQKRKIAGIQNPGLAKRYGREHIKITPEWGATRIQVMEDLLRIKFAKQGFKDSLLATGDEELQEGNSWGDKFWGTVNGVGANNLGILLMKLREEYKNELCNKSA
jgi:ribA/ribD-fused uncharacterized protein